MTGLVVSIIGEIVHVEMCHLLRCPECKIGELRVSDSTQLVIQQGNLECETCSGIFPVQDGIPVFLPHRMLCTSSDRDFPSLDSSTRQKILQREWHDAAHIADGDGYKQATYSDRGLFAFLLHYQLREVEALLADRRYSRIANICCGHGFELDFLSLLCEDVVVIDISLKSLRRALIRAEQLGIRVEALCSDAENLPLRDDGFDLVLTHHSLHHLANPMIGLEEMLRVSASRVALFEPAKGLTRSLVRALRLKPEVEQSGNLVYEFSRKEIQELCQRAGARLRYFQKCLTTGPTSEPEMFRWLDAYGITPVLCSTIRAANRLLGRSIGTKCSVVLDKFPHTAQRCDGGSESIQPVTASTYMN